MFIEKLRVILSDTIIIHLSLFRSLGRYTKCKWKDIKVGDLVHLSCNEMIPADILILRSSDDHGLCYIDTQNLDGEANLKQREVPRGFVDDVRK
jgi:P-type E1-E2 ATPase